MLRADNLYHLHVPIIMKCGSLKLLELSGPVQTCNGTALLCTKRKWPSLSIYCLFCDVTTIPNIYATESGLLLRVHFHATFYFGVGGRNFNDTSCHFQLYFCQFRPTVSMYVWLSDRTLQQNLLVVMNS